MEKTLEGKLALLSMIAELKGVDIITVQGPSSTTAEKPAIVVFYPYKDYSSKTIEEDTERLIEFFWKNMSGTMWSLLTKKLQER